MRCPNRSSIVLTFCLDPMLNSGRVIKLACAQASSDNSSMRTPVEEARSPRGAWKTEICRRDDGTFQVFLMRWTEEVVPDYGKVASFWSDVRTAVSITDSIDTAREIARNLLETHAHDEYEHGSEEPA